MAKPYKMDRKNVCRRAESMRVREERVITGYVKNAYPNIYEEARQFFSYLDSVYPLKKDLRKTNEYASINHGSKRKKYYPRIQKEKPKEKPKEKLQDTMVLRIPLMARNNTETEIQSVDIPLYSQQEEHRSVDIPLCSQQEERLEMETTTPETPTQEGHLEILDEQTLSDIIEDLSENPDFRNMFDNFDYESDDCPLW